MEMLISGFDGAKSRKNLLCKEGDCGCMSKNEYGEIELKYIIYITNF